MNKIAVLFLALVYTASAAPYSKNIVHVLQQLRTNVDSDIDRHRELPLIDGCAVGYGGIPGSFYLLYPYFKNRASTEDLNVMMKDDSPAVRLMAAKILLHSERHDADPKMADSLLTDNAPVLLAAFGCVFSHTTVGAVVKQMKEDPHLLGELSVKEIKAVAPFLPTP